ncbi:MAG: glucose-1-phosphate cytidylyltransferase [Nitrospinota bacterium]
MKVVILCGGAGTRLREYTESIPKPMLHVGDRPILWHIMKSYAHYGFRDFILCLGYRGGAIKDYFVHYDDWKHHDFRLSGGRVENSLPVENDVHQWSITFADTGLDTNTGGRIKRIEKYIDEDCFFATYGDGLSDIDLRELLAFHRRSGKIATVTCVNPRFHFGLFEFNSKGEIVGFQEKPTLDHWVNGGFFVFGRAIFDYLEPNSVLEREPMERLAREGQLAAHKFTGFWKCMDTYKDREELNALWKRDDCPWRVW